MKINAVTDPSFREYGQIVDGYDKEELLAILRSEMEIAETMAYVGAAGALRVIQAFYPLLKKSSGTALVVNISSEAGSIGTCYRTGMTDYAITKAAVNMITKTLWNVWKDDEDMNILCVHPGWVRTNEGNALAPFDSYEQAETLRLLFETRRNVKDGNLFLTYAGEMYPW